MEQFELVKAEVDDSFVQYFLDKYHDDICKFFPDQDFAFPKDAKAYLVTHEGRPVGLTIGKQEKDRLELLLDYSIEAYRDFSIGTFLFEQLAKEDIRTITYAGPDEQHQEYLQKMAEGLSISARTYHKILKVARTIADLSGLSEIDLRCLTEAVHFNRMYGA